MGKRCVKCNVPLEGVMYRLSSILFGVRPSVKDSRVCNKCEDKAAPVMKSKEIGKVTHYYSHLSVAIIELSDTLKVGDRIRIKGHTSDFTQGIASMQIEHTSVHEGKRGDLVGIKVSQKAHPNDLVYRS